MRVVIPTMNGLVAGTGAYAYLNAETWAGSMVVVLVAGSIILWGEYLRRTPKAEASVAAALTSPGEPE